MYIVDVGIGTDVSADPFEMSKEFEAEATRRGIHVQSSGFGGEIRDIQFECRNRDEADRLLQWIAIQLPAGALHWKLPDLKLSNSYIGMYPEDSISPFVYRLHSLWSRFGTRRSGRR